MKPEVAKWVKEAPKAIKVGGFDYELTIQSDWLKNSEGENSWGLCDFANRKFQIGNTAGVPSVRELASTLLHEIMHAIWDQYYLGKKASEENAIRALEQGLVGIFRDNPKLGPWLIKAIV
jgi:hypothetical protein